MPKLKKLTCPHCPGRKFNSQGGLAMHHREMHVARGSGAAKIPVGRVRRGFWGWLFGRTPKSAPRAAK